MAESIRTQRVARMLQKALGDIFLKETKHLVGNAFITVTAVQVGPDLSLSKVYLSFISPQQDKAPLLEKVDQHKHELRRLLGNSIGKKLRKVPVLQFYLDESAAHASKINQLLSQLAIPAENADEGNA